MARTMMTIEWVMCKSCLCPELLFAQGLALGMTKHYIPIWEYVKYALCNSPSIHHGKENSTCLKSGTHKAPNRCSGAKVVLKARTVMPALRPARIPAGVSSTTTQWSYRTPRRSAAFKYPSGSGFPRKTSSALIRSGGTGRPAHSSLTVANALLAEVTTAH